MALDLIARSYYCSYNKRFPTLTWSRSRSYYTTDCSCNTGDHSAVDRQGLRSFVHPEYHIQIILLSSSGQPCRSGKVGRIVGNLNAHSEAEQSLLFSWISHSNRTIIATLLFLKLSSILPLDSLEWASSYQLSALVFSASDLHADKETCQPVKQACPLELPVVHTQRVTQKL